MNLNLNLKLMGKMPVTMDEKRDEEQKQQESAETPAKAEGAPAPKPKAVTASVQDVLAAYAKGDIKLISTTGRDMPEISEGVTQFTYGDSRVTTYLNKGNLSIEVRGKLDPYVIKDFPIKSLPDFKPITPDDNEPVGVVNGEIDETVSQGGTGDCWIIAGVLALNGTESGKKIIKEAIQVNGDGSVTVHFKGLNVSYTITAAEIKKHDTDKIKNDAYSNGDNDMLVLELATKKLMADIARGKVKLDVSKDSPEAIYNEDGSIEGGFAQNMIYYLTGIQADFIYAYDKEEKGLSQKEVLDFLKNAYEEGNNALTFGIYGRPHSAKLIDGTTYSLDISGGHALAITELTDTTVTFVNPWDSTTKYTMTWEEFAKLGVGMISSTPLPKVEDSNPSEPFVPVEPEPVVPIEPEPIEPEPVAPVEPEPLLPDSNANVYSADSLKNVPQNFINRCLEPVSYNVDGSVKEYKLKANYYKIEFSTETIKINGVEINHIRVETSSMNSLGLFYEYYTKADLDKLFGNDPFWKEAFDQYFDCVDKEKGLYRVKSGYRLYELAKGCAHYDTKANNDSGSIGISCNTSDPHNWNRIEYKGITVYNAKPIKENFNSEIIDMFFTVVKNDNGEILGYALKEPYTNLDAGFGMIAPGYSEKTYDFYYDTEDGLRHITHVTINNDGNYRIHENTVRILYDD